MPADPESMPGSQQSGRRSSSWQSLLFVAIIVALQGIRYFRTTDRVWAEDGAIFGRQAFDMRPLRALRESYAGYLVVGQRLIAAPIVRLIPPNWWSEWFAFAAMAVATIAGLAVFRSAKTFVPSPIARGVLGAYLVVGPKMRGEWPSITNIAWPLLLAVFWVIVTTETDLLTMVLRFLIALTPLCTPLALLLLPVCIAVLVLRRSSTGTATGTTRRADWFVAVTLGITSLIQVVGMQSAKPGPVADSWTSLGVLRLLLVRSAGSVVFGEKWLGDAWVRGGDIVSAVGLALIVLIVGYCFARRKVNANVIATIGAILGITIGALSLALRGMTRFALIKGTFSANADRYFLLPTFLLVSAIFIITSQFATKRWVTLLSIYIGIVGIGLGLTLPGSTGDPSWEKELATVRTACATAPKPSLRLNTPIAPLGLFQFAVPCKRLK
jgi:hypothetical protein